MIPENLSAIGTAMANHLWQSTLFALLAAVSTLALRKNQARVRHHLWLAASLKFLVPFSLLMSLGSHLARLHGSADAQPVFYFVLQTMSQPFHQDHGRSKPVAMVTGNGSDPMAGRICHCDRSLVVTLAERRCGDPRRCACFSRARTWRFFAE